MPLQKQPVSINFSQGLDTKTDPWQVQAGKMLVLNNSIFDKGGLLQKRNGYQQLENLSNLTSSTMTTFLGNLIAIGDEFNVRSDDTKTWYNRGSFQPLELSVIPTVRTSTNLTTVDIAIASNLLSCSVYTDSAGNCFYQINDSNTGQIIVTITALPSGSSAPRVFSLNNFFVITFINAVSTTYSLKYISINVSNPSTPSAAAFINSGTVASPAAGYDGVTFDNVLYIGVSCLVGSTKSISFYSLNSQFQLSTAIVLAAHSANYMSATLDSSGSSPVIWFTFWDSTSTNIYTIAYNPRFLTLLGVTQLVSSVTIAGITSYATNMNLTAFYEVVNTYSYSSVRTDYISTVTCTQSGTVGTPAIVIRSLGLASKAFYRAASDTIYMLGVYGGSLQPTYFLIDQRGNVISKLAYSNAFGYASSQILPHVNLINDVAQVGYLLKDTLVSVNKTQGLTNSTGVYAQAGINLASFEFDHVSLTTSEIGNNLNITGGYLWMYDGAKPVEQNFHVWPEDLGFTSHTSGGGLKAQQYFYQATYEWTDAQGNLFRSAPSVPLEVDLSNLTPTGLTFTSVFSSGDTVLTVSDTTDLHVGQVITDTTTGGNIAAGTTILAISGSTITLSLPTAGNSASSPGDTLSTSDTLSVTINVPTLRLTSKVSPNPIRIVLYRWSTAQQIYYQDTLIASPVINDTTVDNETILDKFADAEILGNVIVYTTGGVVENIAAPACSVLTLFKSRLMLLDSEDRNLIWYSKQVIESTPVEMSDLFTIYVAPTISAQGSTGPITALSAMDDKLIIFKENAIYYLTGSGPDNTGANNDFTDPVFITSTVGCTNQQSIVFMPQGLMFQSNKGIWLLGRDLSTQYIGAAVEAYNSNLVQSAVNIPTQNQVRFTLNSGMTLMYDYYYGQWGTFSGVPAISSTIYQDFHTYLNSFGQVYQESPGSYLDGSNPVLMTFTTSWFNLAGLQGYERAYFFYILGNYLTPHKLSVQISYDYNPYPTQTSLITPLNFSPTYGGDALYGSGSPYGDNLKVEQWRVFLQTQKCESFQITISEIYDPSLGVPAGAGLTISGLDLIIGAKSGYPRLKAAVSIG